MSAPWPSRPLFNPGPVRLSPAVRRTLDWPEVGHRDPDFLALFHGVREGLLDVYSGVLGTAHRAVAFAGSGASAVDAMVLDAAAEGGSTAVLEGGPYAARMRQTLTACGRDAYAVDFAPGQSPVDRLDDGLRPGTGRVAVVHHDTASATVLDLAAVAAWCADRGLDLVVDSVSSFGCEPLAATATGRTWWATCSNKALEAAPGVALCLRPRDLPVGRHTGAPITLDLGLHAQAQERGDVAFTLPTHTVATLSVALDELRAEGGWRGRQARYARRSAELRRRLRHLGLWPVLSGVEHSAALTLAGLPPHHSFASMSTALEAQGLRVYPGQAAYADSCFRVSVMGAISDDDVDRVAGAVEELCR